MAKMRVGCTWHIMYNTYHRIMVARKNKIHALICDYYVSNKNQKLAILGNVYGK